MTDRISAREAADRLGVKRETIYAYVSRGLLESQRAIDGKSSTFSQSEVDRLRRRRAGGRPGRLEVPVASGVTEVIDGHVAYRGRPLAELLETNTYEDVAELLWTAQPTTGTTWSAPRSVANVTQQAARALPRRATPADRIMAGVVAAGAADPFRDERSLDGVTTTGRSLIAATVDALEPLAEPATTTIAARLWVRLTAADPSAWPVLDTAMVALADHGMASSTLAARLAASTRAGPHAVLLTGLGAVAGPLHGGAGARVHELLVDAERRDPDRAIAAVLSREGKVPGIGHFIHRRRDPRHEALADKLASSTLDPDRLDVIAEVVARLADRLPVAPNVDFALGALTYSAAMEPTAGNAIFAIARSAGWLAHALEEYEEAPLRFRPVGRYVGEPAGR